jgi:hypothetical protein
MKKSSAITFSILIMLVALGALLGFTSFYIDQATIQPIISMKDSEVSLKCFMTLVRLGNGKYLRMGETVPQDSLRSKLVTTYNLQDSAMIINYDYLQALGYSGVFSGNEEEFIEFLKSDEYSAQCYIRSYGPVERGFVAIYK